MSAGRHVNTCLPTTHCCAGIGEGAQIVLHIFSLNFSSHFSASHCISLNFTAFHCISLYFTFYNLMDRLPVVLWMPFLLCKYYPLYSFWLFETLNRQHVIHCNAMHCSKKRRNYCDPDNSWLWCAEFPWCTKDLANHEGKSLYNLQFGDDQINSLLHVLTTKVCVLWNIYNSGTITSNTT